VPVSSPSYFPPNSSTDQVRGLNAGRLSTGSPLFLAGSQAGQNSTTGSLIIIGHLSGNAGITDTHLAGTVIIGDTSCQGLTTGDGTAAHPVTVLGQNNFNTLVAGGNLLVAGSNNFANWGGIVLTDNVVLGNSIFPTSTSSATSGNESILIGNKICTGVLSGSLGVSQGSIVIGNGVNNTATTAFLNSSIIIGNTIASFSNISTTVLIGSSITIGATAPGSSVLIGNGISMTGNNGGDDRNVGIGQGQSITGVQSTVLGQGAKSPATLAQNTGNIIIGASAGVSLAANTQGVLVIEEAIATLGSAGVKALIFGNFIAGNIIFGNSTVAANRDFGGAPGTNMVKLLNGTAATGAAIIGGGYFYVIAGVLHWVDSSGVDSQLSESVQGQLASSALVAFTNNAGASAGTLTNAPAIGNPTKWIPINDNGTIRNIPAW
jgi:hypothetical protein